MRVIAPDNRRQELFELIDELRDQLDELDIERDHALFASVLGLLAAVARQIERLDTECGN